MTNAEILRKAMVALKSFLNKDMQLLALDASERSISHKFAEHLQKKFAEWTVDCEYNRRGKRPKTLPAGLFGDISDNDQDAKTIFPDIIVHRRSRRNNLLVIEVKKSNSNITSDKDEVKLRAFTGEGDYRYKVGLFLVFDVERQNIKEAKCFKRGHEVAFEPSIRNSLKELGYVG